MTETHDWAGVLDALAQRGWRARVVPVERLADLRVRMERELSSGGLDEETAVRIAADLGWEPEAGALAPAALSVVIGAKARPLTQAALTVGGERHVVVVPPH
ncbi:MAG: hypothetical protein WCN81_10145, partial [Actinomycetes bacterium]